MFHEAPLTDVASESTLPTPADLRARFGLDGGRREAVLANRQAVADCLSGADDRLLVVVGPCSLDDPDAALVYGERLRRLADGFSDTLLLVMRAYFEKPRTRLGWKGAIHDPGMDNSGRVGEGLLRARQLLWHLSGLGLPLASELLDPLCAPYLEDLLSWAAIGARTSESQVHRELASGLPCPVGFKNGTDGDYQAAIDGIVSARSPHTCLGIDAQGRAVVRRTAGNRWAHLVLRGGRAGPNHHRCDEAKAALLAEGVPLRVLVDCSHANSGKCAERQPQVLEHVAERVAAGRTAVGGVMFESHLVAGRQDITPGGLRRFGQSVTDPCIDLDATQRCLQRLAKAVRDRRLACAYVASMSRDRCGPPPC